MNPAALAEADRFLNSYRAGKICVHPSDTLPGLTLAPESSEALARLNALKGRSATKELLGLCWKPERAFAQWQTLPPGWAEALSACWPGPLTVIWQASTLAPPAMCNADGGIALRVPRLPPEFAWFHTVLEYLAEPLPSTSLNRSGEAVPNSESEFHRIFKDQLADIYVPTGALAQLAQAAGMKASTIIRILPDGRYVLLRAGAEFPALNMERADHDRNSPP